MADDDIKRLKGLNLETLPPGQLGKLASACQQVVRFAEIVDALSDALTADKPGFNGFNDAQLDRLSTFISTLQEPNRKNKNLDTLEGLRSDPIAFVICGVSLRMHKTKRLHGETLEGIIRHAKDVSPRLLPIFSSYPNITDVIQKSTDEEFKASYIKLVAQYLTEKSQHARIVWWNSLQCHHFVVTHRHKFTKLTSLSLDQVVSIYMPLVVAFDCFIRLTTSFDERLLTALCGSHAETYEAGGFPLSASKHLIPAALGEDVFHAIQASGTWQQELDQEITQCVKMLVYAPHVIIIDVIVQDTEGSSFINGK